MYVLLSQLEGVVVTDKAELMRCFVSPLKGLWSMTRLFSVAFCVSLRTCGQR